jgi:hypothetical protein
MQAFRAQLDALFGVNRDGDFDAYPAISRRHFSDPGICKQYLTGYCLRDLFRNTHVDMGACNRLHSDALRVAYQQDPDRDRYPYRHDLLAEINRLIRECDSRIEAGKRRVDSALRAVSDPPPEMSAKIAALQTSIAEAEAQVAAKTAAGDIEDLDELLIAASTLKQELDTVVTEAQAFASAPALDIAVDLRLQACDVCSAMLSATDNDRRLTDHFGGKQHQGYQTIRQLQKTLQQELDDAPRPRTPPRPHTDCRDEFTEPPRPSRGRDTPWGRDSGRYLPKLPPSESSWGAPPRWRDPHEHRPYRPGDRRPAPGPHFDAPHHDRHYR